MKVISDVASRAHLAMNEEQHRENADLREREREREDQWQKYGMARARKPAEPTRFSLEFHSACLLLSSFLLFSPFSLILSLSLCFTRDCVRDRRRSA